MKEEKYLLMFEDWNIWTQTEITEDDKESVVAGIMSIVRISDMKYYDGSEWIDIEPHS